MKISNHTVYNYTGINMKLYKLYKSGRSNILDDVKYLEMIPSGIKYFYFYKISYKMIINILIFKGKSYEIEYFSNHLENDNFSDLSKYLLRENYIIFELEGIKASDKIIKIDNISARKHNLDYKEFKLKLAPPISQDYSNFEYIISLIKIDQIKHSIIFYSPLSLENKSDQEITIVLKRKGLENLSINLLPEETFGIPYQYFDGFILFEHHSSKPIAYEIRKFLINKNINEELNFNEFLICLSFKSSISESNKIDPYKKILITSPYIIQNLLPFDITIKILNGDSVYPSIYNIDKTRKTYIYKNSSRKDLTCYLEFLNFKTKNQITLYDRKNKIPNEMITIEDPYKNKLNIFVCIIDRKTRTLGIYCSAVLINNTLLDNLKFFYFINKKKKNIAGQGDNINIILLSDEKQLIIEYRDYLSQPLNLTIVGINTILELKNKDGKKIEFFVQSNLSLLSPELNLYSNIFNISPRFIIYNKLDNEVLIGVLDNSSEREIINSKERKPFYFFGYGSDIKIIFRVLEQSNNSKYQSGSKWNWSCPVTLNSDRIYTFQIMSLDGTERKFINIEKKLDHYTTFLIMSESDFKNCHFVIENYCKLISIKMYQYAQEGSALYIKPVSKSMFSWIEIFNKNILNIQPILGHLDDNPLIFINTLKSYELLEDRINILTNNLDLEKSEFYPFADIIEIKTGLYCGYRIKVEFQTSGFRKIIKISDIAEDAQYFNKDSNSYYETEINLNIDYIGLSLIGDNKNISNLFNDLFESETIQFQKSVFNSYTRNEIFYISFKNISFYMKEDNKNKNSQISMQLKIQEIEVDNQYSYLTHFPIILRPAQSRKFNNLNEKEKLRLLSKRENDSKNKNYMIEFPPFFNCLILFSKGENDQKFKIKLLNYLIQSCIISLDTLVLQEVLNFFNNLSLDMKTTFTYINRVFLDNKKNIMDGVFIKDNFFDPMWVYMDLEKETKEIFIQQLETSPIEIHFSFISHGANNVFQKFLGSNPVLTSLISTISNIEDANIELNGSIMNNVFGDLYQICDSIIDLYKQEFLAQIMKIFGSIDIFGNPANLLNNLGSGFKDFFQKPYQGMVKGPLEGAKGIMDGSLSLVKHTVGGTFSSTSKIAGGISHGILHITQDHEYINDLQKKKITEKPKNFIEGIGYGISSMAGGIYHGVTDIVMKPYEGAKKEKWAGFGKGIMKGLAGVVVKPISGVLELVSKTTEGIKNTVVSDQILKMERLPRTFYGKFKYVNI